MVNEFLFLFTVASTYVRSPPVALRAGPLTFST